MPDTSYDRDSGVSVWDHVLNGAKTGGMAGSFFGGVGAIPGAILGGGVGLATGLWDSHQDSVAEEAWNKHQFSDKEMNKFEKDATTAVAADKDNKLKTDVDLKDRVWHNNQYDKQQAAGGPSLWDTLF
jgi:hypothetical protein